VDLRRFLIAAAVLVLLVAAVMAVLIALPLPVGFFRENGALAGPVAWIFCTALAGRLLGLSLRRTALAAAAGGVTAAVAGALVSHTAGVALGVVVWAGFVSRRPRSRAAGRGSAPFQGARRA